MKHYNLITKVTELCASNYDLKTFNHCLRVANYVVNNVCLENDESRETAYIIALCHDLLEDTEVSIDEIVKATGYSKGFLSNVLCALTREKDEAYKNYVLHSYGCIDHVRHSCRKSLQNRRHDIRRRRSGRLYPYKMRQKYDRQTE